MEWYRTVVSNKRKFFAYTYIFISINKLTIRRISSSKPSLTKKSLKSFHSCLNVILIQGILQLSFFIFSYLFISTAYA